MLAGLDEGGILLMSFGRKPREEGRALQGSHLRRLISGLTLAWCIPAAAQNVPLAIVPVNDVKVSGDMIIADGRATIGRTGTITAMDHTATIVLPHRGNLHICTSTTLNLMRDSSIAASLRSTEEPGLMMALDRGAMEANFATGQNSDVILTPDFRIVISGPGVSSVQVRLGLKGDTCVDNRGPNAPYVSVSSVFKGGVYRVQENQRVMFQHGSLDEVVDHETEGCGCPSEDSKSATGNDFPLAQSEGLTPLGKAPANATEKGMMLGQVTAQFGYDGRKQKAPIDADTTSAPARPQSKISAQIEKLDPRRSLLKKIGHFLRNIFGG